ncbi:ComF family protein [Lysinibacillus odysseyi]|uniref:Competence protein ComFC n=1 Tax=Lysinibacillus odysseyi 34hs-1 = NBRC 100172 TaxID=1220589 RepID=A0A0A3J9W3_9BACI|nr:ComF family protein [Lysinibacillus odysseyi]KGR83787.1 competence protein ComFC [Lysinibacillus odysseyi 34hs-1 = NBRC 100172]
MLKEVHNCLLCQKPLQTQVSWLTFFERFPPIICADCEGKFELSADTDPDHRSLYQYNEPMKDFLHRYKFLYDVVLAKVFQRKLHDLLKNEKRIIVAVPMHPEKLLERTFSPVEELLNAAKISYTPLLEKTTTDTQSKKTREERLNTPQLFRTAGEVKAAHYVVFDDIYTTGTTIEHAKRALLEAGAKSVASVTLIRG